MSHPVGKGPPIIEAALGVTIMEGELLLDAQGSAMPSLTAEAARATAQRLVDAADELEAQGKRSPLSDSH